MTTEDMKKRLKDEIEKRYADGFLRFENITIKHRLFAIIDWVFKEEKK